MAEFRVSDKEHEAAQARLRQTEREAREAAVERQRQADLDERVRQAELRARYGERGVDPPPAPIVTRPALPTSLIDKLLGLRVDQDGYVIVRLHPEERAALCSVLRLAQAPERRPECLDRIAVLVETILARYGEVP